MQQVTVDEARDNLSVLIEAALKGEEVVINKDDDTAVRLTPVVIRKPQPRFGSAKGLMTLAPDFDEPLADFDEYTR